MKSETRVDSLIQTGKRRVAYKGVANKEKSKKLSVQLIKGFETRVSNKFCLCILNDVPQLDEYPDRVNRILDLGTFIKDATLTPYHLYLHIERKAS